MPPPLLFLGCQSKLLSGSGVRVIGIMVMRNDMNE